MALVENQDGGALCACAQVTPPPGGPPTGRGRTSKATSQRLFNFGEVKRRGGVGGGGGDQRDTPLRPATLLHLPRWSENRAKLSQTTDEKKLWGHCGLTVKRRLDFQYSS